MSAALARDGVDAEPVALLVEPIQLLRWIDRVLPHLAKMAAGSDGRFATRDIVDALMLGKMHLWLCLIGQEIACVMVTEFVEYPRGRALRFNGLVGKGWRRWVHLRGVVEDWGRRRGCVFSEMMLHSTKWLHLTEGYKMDHIRVAKKL